MIKNRLSAIFFSILCFNTIVGTNLCFADDAFSPIKIINPNGNNIPKSEVNIDLNRTWDNSKKIDLSENDTFYHLINATDKFVQCNIRASWEDFKTLINTSVDNDFTYISLANKMADFGLFDLATLASSKIKDKDLSGISIDAMKRFYYPKRRLKLEDELSLAETYSNILYNNQSSEATNELLRNETLLSTSDYANYLVALGSYKSSFYPRAAQYINIAIIQNPTNLNYQKLKAEILAEGKEPEEAIKIVETLKKQNLFSSEYERKIKSLEQFVLYKTSKNEWEKDYHLGYYYYLENDPSKAIRTLTAVSTQKRTNSGVAYALMSEIYLTMNEFEKASDTAKKAFKINKNNPKALTTLGDLSYNDKDYKQSLYYYKKAAAVDKKDYTPLVKEAKTYQKLANQKKAKEIFVKVLKTHSDSWEAYYNIALLDENKNKDKEIIYLKKALDINPLFEAGWVELAKAEIGRGNYEIAEKYLSNAYYIDENDFRYYYYQGLINKTAGDYTQAEYNFKKCLKLNSNFKEAQNELNSIINTEDNKLKQDNI